MKFRLIFGLGSLLMLLSITLVGFKSTENVISTPIYFPEYGVEIRFVASIGDTIKYNKSGKEDFKFVFYDIKGRCYCERYINGKLYQKGGYENSLDTLKRYVSGRNLNGKHSLISVQSYFEPLKNGIWITYLGKKQIKKDYLMGILQ